VRYLIPLLVASSVARIDQTDSEFKGSTSNTYECGGNLIFRWHLATTLEQEHQEPSNPFLIPNNLLDIPLVVSIHTHYSRPNSRTNSYQHPPKNQARAIPNRTNTYRFLQKQTSYPSDPCNHPKKKQ
jgi:hypothetical protein